MNTQARRTFLFMLMLTVGGCAQLGLKASVPEKDKADFNTIAVTSVLGNSFHGIFIGTTIFTNKHYTVDVTEWNVDSEAIKTAVEKIGGEGQGWKIVPVPVSTSDQVGRDAALVAARDIGADTLVVVAPSGYDNQPDFIRGYGYHKRTFLGLDRECIYSLLIIETYRVATGKRIAWEWGFAPMSGVPCYGKDKNIPWKEEYAQYSESEISGIRDAILESVRANVATGIERSGL